MKIFLLALYDEWCLSLRMLSAVLRKEGHEVRLAYLQSYPQIGGQDGRDDPEGYHVWAASVSGADFKALGALVRDFDPGLIGVTTTSSFYGLTQRVTEVMRAASPAPIIWGGVDATANPELSIACADMVCIGEGEELIVELTGRLAAGQDITRIQGLWVRQNGEIHRNPIRPLNHRLEALPWADFDPRNKYWISGGKAHEATLPPGSALGHSFPIIAARGCLYSCTYCCNSMYRELYGAKDYVRLRPVEDVVEEIVHYVKDHPEVEIIEFFDDVFGFDSEWMARFAEIYPRRVGKPFWCFTYPAVCRPELVQWLKQAGVSYIVMGVQSGSQRTLREDYHRNASRQKTIEAARLIRDSGIALFVDLILGNPFETEQDYLDTLELLLELPPGVVSQEINYLTLYRNYPLSKKAEEAGYHLTWYEGWNAAQVMRQDEFIFWRGILMMVQFPQIKPETLRTMARDPLLRANPEVVNNLALTLEAKTYLPGTRIDRVAKLEAEVARLNMEIHRYRGSRAVQWYFRLKKRFF